MKLSGLHLLLTYQCTLECDHCFLWGSPRQSGTMSLDIIRHILKQAKDLGTVGWVYFEGGEPFLYYAILLAGVEEAKRLGFQVGIVSNGYWATGVEEALAVLRPFSGLVGDLSVSSDSYHWEAVLGEKAKNACAAAQELGIPHGVISIVRPGDAANCHSPVMYRGRAAEKLVREAPLRHWEEFAECPHEDLREPGRLHVDPFGNLHICQGISVGNLFQAALRDICAKFDPGSQAIIGPLLAGGPTGLVRAYELAHETTYADACHLCYEARKSLRGRLPEILGPDQMYGDV